MILTLYIIWVLEISSHGRAEAHLASVVIIVSVVLTSVTYTDSQ